MAFGTGAGQGLTDAGGTPEDTLGAILAATTDGFWVVDRSGRLLDVNEAYCAMSGYSREELLGASVSLLEAEETPEQTALHIDSVVAHGSDRFETRHRAKSGCAFDVEVSAVHLRESGRLACFLRDVTERNRVEAERRRTEDALRASEARLRLHEAAVEAAANAVLLCDREGVIVWVNRAFTTLTGWQREEVLGKTPRVLRSGLQERAFYLEMWQTVLGGRPWRGELTNRRKDGSLYLEEMTITPVRDAQGAVSHLIAIKQDVGWRREAERMLRDSERRYRELVQGLEAIVWEAEPGTWRITFVSEPAERILGYPVEQWLAEESFFLDHLHPVDRETILSQKAAGQTRAVEDFRLQAADGRWLWFHGTARLAQDESGRPTRVSAVMVDITTHRELEMAIRAAADEWTASFDALETGLLVLNAPGRIVRLNRAAADALGAGWDACLGRTLGEVGLGEPWAAAQEAVAEARREGKAGVRTATDSSGRTWNVDATRVGGTGDWDGRVIVSVRDVTQLAALQESVRRAEALATLGSIVGAVAHEVRNPLFAMSANIDALEIVLRGQEDVRELLDALCRERDRTVRLMDDLLHYGRPASARRVRGGLDAALAAAVEACRPAAAALGVAIERTGDGSDPEMLLDAGRLQEVLENLLENACQHSPPGSTVTLDLRVSGTGAARLARCTVRDRGKGFSPDILTRAFEPFFTDRKGGIGLGLAIVRRIVEEHGGQVLATNAPEGGAEVIVELPLLPGYAEADPS